MYIFTYVYVCMCVCVCAGGCRRSQVLLALKTLEDYKLEEDCRRLILPFVKDNLVPFLHCAQHTVRSQAAATIGTVQGLQIRFRTLHTSPIHPTHV